MTDREAPGVVDKAKKFGDAWAAIVVGASATVSLATQSLPLVQQMSAALRWGAGLAGTVPVVVALVYMHRRRRAAERERDEARAGQANVPTKEQLAKRWPLERALLVDVVASDADPAVELQNDRTDIKVPLRLANQAPFRVRTLKLALRWSLTDTEGHPLLRGKKEVIEAFGALKHGDRELHMVELTAEALKLGPQPLAVARLAIVGEVVAESDVWDGNAKANIGSFTWAVVVDRVAERLVGEYDGILAGERKARR